MDAKVGDFDGNRATIVSMADEAARGGAEFIVFPELCVCGYPPLDLLDWDGFVRRCGESLRALQRDLPRSIPCALGTVAPNRRNSGKPLVNQVAIALDGRIVFEQAKTLLPTYDVFDESRWFEPADVRRAFEYRGQRIGFAICEDIWWEEPVSGLRRYEIDPVRDLLDDGATLLVVPSASPFHAGKLDVRRRLASGAARQGGCPVLYCNMCGADDSLVFDGRSFSVDRDGFPVTSAGWEPAVVLVDSEAKGQARAFAEEPRWLEVERALVEGIRGYVRKSGFSKVLLGLSGGIDSALVAALAAEALGPENVACIAMPSRYSSRGSIEDSEELCRRLGLTMHTIPIEAPHAAYLGLLEGPLGPAPLGLVEENLQARIRGDILMAWSNRFGSLLLTTGNKSEIATGYCTLYGDMCGALAPIGDLFKTEVYALCRAMNDRADIIPRAIIDKPPSAELRPGQRDQDSLPPYELLDAILDAYLLRNLDAAELVAEGFDLSLAERVVSLVAKSEYKRRQAAPVIKVSRRAFGEGRRIPIVRAAFEASP
jgi:NAD+ synthase (glutamine-hydrolysing)